MGHLRPGLQKNQENGMAKLCFGDLKAAVFWRIRIRYETLKTNFAFLFMVQKVLQDLIKSSAESYVKAKVENYTRLNC